MTRTERTYYVLEGSFQTWGWFLSPVYTIFLLSKGLDVFQLNVVLATYFVATTVFEVPTGAVADVYGRRISFISSCFVRSSAFLMYAFADDFTDCLIAEVIDGFGYTLASGALEAWAVDGVRAEGDDRPADRMFARVEMIVRGTMILGGILGGTLADIDIRIPWFIATFGFAATGLYATLAMREIPGAGPPAPSGNARPSLTTQIRTAWTAARSSRVIATLCVLAALSGAALLPVLHTWPARLEALSGSGYWVLGVASALLNGAALCGAALTTRVLGRRGRETVLSATSLMRAVATAGAALGTAFVPTLAGLLVGEVMGGIARPASQAWINEHIGSAQRATVLSIERMAFTLGASTGLVALGLVGRAYGFPTAWLAAACLFLVVGLGYLTLRSQPPSQRPRPA